MAFSEASGRLKLFTNAVSDSQHNLKLPANFDISRASLRLKKKLVVNVLIRYKS